MICCTMVVNANVSQSTSHCSVLIIPQDMEPDICQLDRTLMFQMTYVVSINFNVFVIL